MMWSALVGFSILDAGGGPSIEWALLTHSDGRKLLIVQRTYRDGINGIWQPTPEDIAMARRDPWLVWNDSRSGYPFDPCGETK